MAHRLSAEGFLTVFVETSGAWKAMAVDGTVVATRAGRGPSIFALQRGMARGLHLLKVSLPGGEAVFKLVL